MSLSHNSAANLQNRVRGWKTSLVSRDVAAVRIVGGRCNNRGITGRITDNSNVTRSEKTSKLNVLVLSLEDLY